MCLSLNETPHTEEADNVVMDCIVGNVDFKKEGNIEERVINHLIYSIVDGEILYWHRDWKKSSKKRSEIDKNMNEILKKVTRKLKCKKCGKEDKSPIILDSELYGEDIYDFKIWRCKNCRSYYVLQIFGKIDI